MADGAAVDTDGFAVDVGHDVAGQLGLGDDRPPLILARPRLILIVAVAAAAAADEDRRGIGSDAAGRTLPPRHAELDRPQPGQVEILGHRGGRRRLESQHEEG